MAAGSPIPGIAPKEVPLHENIFGTVGDSLFCCKKESTIIVLKDGAFDIESEFGWEL
jgi:hypothetical protein